MLYGSLVGSLEILKENFWWDNLRYDFDESHWNPLLYKISFKSRLAVHQELIKNVIYGWMIWKVEYEISPFTLKGFEENGKIIQQPFLINPA